MPALLERLAFRTVRRADQTTGLLTAFGVSIILQNLFLLLGSPRPIPATQFIFLDRTFLLGSMQVSSLQIYETVATALAIGALMLFLRRSTLGLAMRAVALDFEMVRLCGLRASRGIGTAFAVSGLLAGLARIFIMARQRFTAYGIRSGAHRLRRLRHRRVRQRARGGAGRLPAGRSRGRGACPLAAKLRRSGLCAGGTDLGLEARRHPVTREGEGRQAMNSSQRRGLLGTALLSLLVLLIVGAYYLWGETWQTRVLYATFVNLLVVIGLQVFTVNANLTNFSHAAFMGIAAYAAAICVTPAAMKAIALPDAPWGLNVFALGPCRP
ncbi:branched-chain amino acid ABC transporter permease [Salipiger sp. 1_MG-2023]|uniref:branched-chain amino acid ABC transporter permease n=1 Tax=Salipiger sp. 1_MG-2023 TaxID=3062665 RepID=UPI0026E3397F|nr:branched-chain amino acid ABC transporter permease [Salipiger sp. 1_MG-2023]MDO6588114.1 branched-chain amino acid ABC transporter permease [Salipiger sp. 1_MG-2023]